MTVFPLVNKAQGPLDRLTCWCVSRVSLHVSPALSLRGDGMGLHSVPTLHTKGWRGIPPSPSVDGLSRRADENAFPVFLPLLSRLCGAVP